MPQFQSRIDFARERAWRTRLLALRSRLAGDAFLAALDRHTVAAKANFNPQQPRQPGPGPGAGRWIYVEGYAQEQPPGLGHNGGPPLSEPPDIPKQDPGDKASRLTKAKAIAKWLAMFGARRIPQVALALAAIEAADWLRTELPSIRSNLDAPKSMEELVAGARDSRSGYHRHHIAEQKSAADDLFPRSMIDGLDNVVSIPIYKHHQITSWYAKPNPNFGGMSPREFLRGKDWQTRMEVGHQALRQHGILK